MFVCGVGRAHAVGLAGGRRVRELAVVGSTQTGLMTPGTKQFLNLNLQTKMRSQDWALSVENVYGLHNVITVLDAWRL